MLLSHCLVHGLLQKPPCVAHAVRGDGGASAHPLESLGSFANRFEPGLDQVQVSVGAKVGRYSIVHQGGDGTGMKASDQGCVIGGIGHVCLF